jgi:hypothetical protein
MQVIFTNYNILPFPFLSTSWAYLNVISDGDKLNGIIKLFR